MCALDFRCLQCSWKPHLRVFLSIRAWGLWGLQVYRSVPSRGTFTANSNQEVVAGGRSIQGLEARTRTRIVSPLKIQEPSLANQTGGMRHDLAPLAKAPKLAVVVAAAWDHGASWNHEASAPKTASDPFSPSRMTCGSPKLTLRPACTIDLGP